MLGGMALGKGYGGQDCSLARALELLGERWTLLIVRDAFYGVRRYNDFLAHLDVPRAVLAERLQRLVDGGVLAKRRYQDSPPRHEYVLTAAGTQLWPTLYTLAQWADRNLQVDGPCRLFFHAPPCGAALDGPHDCPQCGPVPLREVEVRPGPGATLSRQDPVSIALRDPHRLLVPVPDS